MESKTPYFIMHKERLLYNLEFFKELERVLDINIYFCLKSFNKKEPLKLIAKYISGATISSKQELKLAKKVGFKDIFSYSTAYKDNYFKEADFVSFNSISQYNKFYKDAPSVGIRVNPKIEFNTPKYCNYSDKNSFLGVDKESIYSLKTINGLHFHTMFRATAEDLETLLNYIDNNFSNILPNLKWLNLGGGYDFFNFNLIKAKKILKEFKIKYPNLKIIFEPGESLLDNLGEFVVSVIDIVNSYAILDTSIETHLLDIAIVNRDIKIKNKKTGDHTYTLVGNSGLRGDIIGKYNFKKPLKIGDIIEFENMIAYTLVKNTNFLMTKSAKFYFN